MTDRKKRERKARKIEILTHARALINEKGLDALTMLEVAKRADLSKASIYTYFKSRDEILFEIRNEAAGKFLEYIQAQLQQDLTGIELLRVVWQSYLSLFGESSDIFICIGVQNKLSFGVSLGDTFDYENNEDPLFLMLQVLEDILKRGIEDGTIIPSINPKKITKLLLLITTNVVQDVVRLPFELRNVNRITLELQNIFELILRGLATDTVDKNILVLT